MKDGKKITTINLTRGTTEGEVTSKARTFASFSEASAFAKSAAIERRCSVSVFQQGDKWLVEVLGMLDATASEANIQSTIAKPKLNYRRLPPETFGSIAQSIVGNPRCQGTRAELELEHILCNVGGGMFRGRFQRDWEYGGRWIIGFYFPEVRLGIEIDGAYTNSSSQQHSDKEREEALARSGITIIRLASDEVLGERESLLFKLHSGWRKAKIASQQSSERKEPIIRYVASTQSTDRVFHRSTCGWMRHVPSDSELVFSSRQSAINKGYTPCKFCCP